MKRTIQNRQKEIEDKHNVAILYACESGSRAWGFPSPDSDYDVRFIYVRTEESYLSVRDEKDFMDFPLNDELDVNGWDLRKTLGLIGKSNAVPAEWMQSPMVYYTRSNFAQEVLQLCKTYFCPRTYIHHYVGIARGASATMCDGQLGVKTLFYILRPLLSALWCLQNRAVPPMHIQALLSLMPTDLQGQVLSLIELKASADERFLIEVDRNLLDWVDTSLNWCVEEAKKIEKSYSDVAPLNDYFRKTIITQR